jgi:hypothetical protein
MSDDDWEQQADEIKAIPSKWDDEEEEDVKVPVILITGCMGRRIRRRTASRETKSCTG